MLYLGCVICGQTWKLSFSKISAAGWAEQLSTTNKIFVLSVSPLALVCSQTSGIKLVIKPVSHQFFSYPSVLISF